MFVQLTTEAGLVETLKRTSTIGARRKDCVEPSQTKGTEDPWRSVPPTL